MAIITTNPSPKPTSGLMTRLSTTRTSPPTRTDRSPACDSDEPTSPPTSACEDDEGMPKYQVNRFQRIAPSRAESTTPCVTAPGSTSPLPIVAATAVPVSAPRKLRTAEIEDSRAQGQDAGAHDGSHGVGRVVEAVDVVERQRGHDHQHEGEQSDTHGDAALRRS